MRCFARGVRGYSLIEVMIAFAVMAAGLVSLVSFHGAIQGMIADARNRAAATALAERKIQTLQSFLSPGAPALQSGSHSEPVSRQLADYELDWSVTSAGASLKQAQVTVAWQDRQGRERQVRLQADIHFQPPTEPLEQLLRIGEAGEEPPHWVTANRSPPPDPGNSGDEPGDGEEANTDSGESPGTETEEEELEYETVTLGGDVEARGNARLETVRAYGNFFMTCELEEGGYLCTTTIPEDSAGWSGALYFTPAGGTVCSPENGSQTYTNITGDQQLDVDLSQQC